MPVTILQGDSRTLLTQLPADSVDCVVTSPPYFGLRDYGVDGQLGLEQTPKEYVAGLVPVFEEVRRVLKPSGTLWLNLGDSYAGSRKGGGGSYSAERRGWQPNKGKRDVKRFGGGNIPATGGLKPKDLIGIPWRVAFALQEAGWYLRQDIIWAKPNPMPESAKDRCTKSHEYLFLLSKAPCYYFDGKVIAEPVAASTIARLAQDVNNQRGSDRVPGKTNGSMKAVGNGKTRNKRSVWFVPTKGFKGAHFATFPPNLIRPCILAGCPTGGLVLDPFAGAGTTGLVALEEGRNALLLELNPDYVQMIEKRLEKILNPSN